MTTQALEEHRRTIREIADAVAPGWERRRAYIETTTTPVREWMLRELAPQPGQTLLELGGRRGRHRLRRGGADRRRRAADQQRHLAGDARRRAPPRRRARRA